MSFIEDKDPIVLNIKLTSKGRELLAGGNLDFKYFALGDSEIDYKFISEVNNVDNDYIAYNSSILRAVDKNANIISFVSQTLSGNPYNELSTVPTIAYTVENQADSIGFFTNNNTEFIIDSNHVKQPDINIKMGDLNGNDVLKLYKGSSYGRSILSPEVGDILLVNWSYIIDTVNDNEIITVNKDKPLPYIFYKIVEIISGSLLNDDLFVRVDKPIPDFNGIPNNTVKAILYYNEINYSGDTIVNLQPTDYLNESVLSFLENNQCPTIVFPFWNMSIIYTEEIAGVQSDNLKYTQFSNRTFGGFVSYIQNQAPTYKKLGVIHYTNSSPANVYGEGFLQNTPVLNIPTIMWHKSINHELGVTLVAKGSQQLLNGLNLYYYDLADENGFIVGKVFNDLKIFVIEDQELLFAMSYKSNRSWTLPDFAFGTNTSVADTVQCSLYAEITSPDYGSILIDNVETTVNNAKVFYEVKLDSNVVSIGQFTGTTKLITGLVTSGLYTVTLYDTSSLNCEFESNIQVDVHIITCNISADVSINNYTININNIVVSDTGNCNVIITKSGSTAQLINQTILGNSGSFNMEQYGGGMYIVTITDPVVENCMVTYYANITSSSLTLTSFEYLPEL